MRFTGLLSDILRDNRFTEKNLPELEAKLFFEGKRRRPYLVRFVVLLFLSTVIATFGVLSDSTATVIGAMIIAPLMTPMLATTAALVMGRAERVVYSILTVIVGITLVVLVSWLLGSLSLDVISLQSNSEIAGRISPNLQDLAVAVAAGAAGAFALSRDDVADSLPGVAIAIALVPPLCVVGIALSVGNIGAAIGASILFLTNFLSILIAGGGIFALLNLGKVAIAGQDLTREGRRKAYTYITLGLLLVAVPLAIASFSVAQDGLLQSQIARVTAQWLEESESDLTLDRVNVYDQEVEILVSGFDEPPPIDSLSREIEALAPDLERALLTIRFSKAVPIEQAEAEQ